MVGTLSQIVALVSYGNAYLHGREIGSAFSNNAEFQYCNSVEFLFPKPTRFWFGKESLADSPLKWLKTLKDRKCLRLKLSHLDTQNSGAPNHILVAFVGGGGRWFIESVYEAGSDYWEGRWEVTNQSAPDRRIWRVSYSVVVKNTKPSQNTQIDLADVHGRFEHTLLEIHSFAQKQKVDNFAAWFRNGIDSLRSDSVSEKKYHKDLVPEGWYSLEAERLLAAASNAWVFGGMGSWNDLLFEGEEKKVYDDLSARLYSVINESVVAAVNSKP